MAAVINTNIASLNAQRNLTSSQSSLQTSLQRLSSGLRINSAKDDAAGLAITSRMTSQIRGLNQATRNANDGISLAQTAEGSLGAVSDNLQRIRELALQSANATNSATDRAALNSEAQELLSEIQRVSETTQFNGLNLLDGTFASSQFQIGANANQTISISISGSSTSQLGAYQASSAAVTDAAFDGSGVTINGIEIGVSVGTNAAGVTADSAAAKATAINAKTTETNVSATASNSVTGASPIQKSSLSSGVLEINGVSIGSIAGAGSGVAQGDSAAAAINAVSNQTGVTATVDRSTGALTLNTSDGRNIALTASTASVANADDIYNATGLDISAGANPTTGDTFNVQVGDVFDLSSPAAGSLTEADTFILDGVTYEMTTDATVSGNNVAVTVADGNTAIQVATAIAGAIEAQYSAGNTSVRATNGGTDTVAITNARLGAQGTLAGWDESGVTGGGGAAALVQSAETAGTGAADGNGVTTRGTLTLSSAESFVMGGADIAQAGLAAASASLTSLSSTDISTITGSNNAIAVIDGALSQVSSQRADLGAYQNRFESVVSSLTTSSENLSAARSRIQDADYAAETAAMTRAQILQQAGTAMLSQANSLPNTVLSLLQ